MPDGTEYKSAKLVAGALDTYPVGPTFVEAVALKVPVNGASTQLSLPLLNAVVPSELITVFNRFSPPQVHG